MSLLGISIDKTKAQERLDSPKGFVAGSTDEQLLKEVGAIVLEKGVWTPKYKGAQVSEFLNWIAEGKPKGPLPTLVKRLLCLKREKLARGIKDAGTADYARIFEKKWIAEIDAIFEAAGERVECVVDFIKTTEKCPPASAAPSTTVAPSITPPSVAPSVAPTVAPSVVSSNKNEDGADGNPPAAAAAATAAAAAEAEAAATATVAKPEGEMDDKGSVKPLDALLEQLTKRHGEVDTEGKQKLERIIANLVLKQGDSTINSIVDEINAVLLTTKPINEKISEINSLLGIKPPIAINGPGANVGANIEAVIKLVHEAVGMKKTAYPEIKHLLQELIYTTCGEASLLDPLVDHLDNLLATFSTMNANNTRFSGLKGTLEELRNILQKEALSMETTQKDGALKGRLEELKEKLTTLSGNNVGGDSLTPDQRNQITALRTQIKDLEILIEAGDGKEAQKEIKRLELARERDLLISLVGISGDKYDKLSEKAKGFLVLIDAESKALESSNPNIKTITTECNKRAFEYRMLLASLKKEDTVEHVLEIEKMKAEHKIALDALTEEKDAIIAGLEERLLSETTTKDGRINELAENLTTAQNTIARMQSNGAANDSRVREANAAKNAAAAELTTARAKIAALEAQLAAKQEELGLGNAAALEGPTNLSQRVKELEAALEEERMGRTGNVASRNIQLEDLTRELNEEREAKNARIEELRSEASKLTEGRRGNAAKIADLSSALEETKTGFASRNARIAELEGDLATRKTLSNASSEGAASEMAALESNIENLRTQMGVVTTERNAQSAAAADLTRRLKEAEAALAAQRTAANEATAAAERNKKTLSADVARLAGELTEAQGAAAHVGTLESNLAAARGKHNANATRIADLEQQLRMTAEELRTTGNARGANATRIADLERQLRMAAEELRTTGNARGVNSTRIADLEQKVAEEKAIVDELVEKLRVERAAAERAAAERAAAERAAAKPTYPPRGYTGESRVRAAAAALESSGHGSDPSKYAMSHRGKGTVLDPTRPARAETAHKGRMETGRAAGTAVRAAGTHGGTRKHKKKIGRHTRKLRK